MRALLSGYYGQGNGGDEALLATLLQMLPPSVTPVVLSGNPEATRQRYGVESHNRMAIVPVLRALASCDALIWGGGSLMQDATSSMSPFYYGGLMTLAQIMGLKTVAWAQGIGPLERRGSRWLAKRNFHGCTQVSVRDRASAKLLKDWQIPCLLAPDPVWALSSQPVPELKHLPLPRVAVTLRNHPQLTKFRLGNLITALAYFQRITRTFIIIVPFHTDEDLAIADVIHSELRGVSQVMTLEDPKLLKGIYQGIDMAIGMRLHSLIMAAAEGCRCFGLSYDPKVSSLMTELKMPGWELTDLPENPNIIVDAWLQHYRDGKPLSPIQRQSIMDRAFMHRELLMEALGEYQ